MNSVQVITFVTPGVQQIAFVFWTEINARMGIIWPIVFWIEINGRIKDGHHLACGKEGISRWRAIYLFEAASFHSSSLNIFIQVPAALSDWKRDF